MKNSYLNAIRQATDAARRRGILASCIVWQVGEDECRDPTLISQRVYGSRQYADVVMQAAGVSGIWEALPLKEIVLPTLSTVLQLRQYYGLD